MSEWRKGGERFSMSRENRQEGFVNGQIEVAHKGSTRQGEERTRSERRRDGELFSMNREKRRERFMGRETEIARKGDIGSTYESRADNTGAEEEKKGRRHKDRKRMSDRKSALTWQRFFEEDEKIDGAMGTPGRG